MTIKDSLDAFFRALRSTKEFNDLIISKKAIERNNTLKEDVITFNKKLSSIYSSNKPQNLIQANVDELYKEFASLTQNKEVMNFLKHSNAFIQMMYSTNQYMNELIQNEVLLK